jgi:glycosyltransferase involved in cell wall biosynthesis
VTPLRIGVDATSWVNRRGYGRFTRNAVGRLVELDREASYVLFIDEQSVESAELPDGTQTCVVPLRRAPSESASADSSRAVGDLLRLSRTARRASLDAFLFPSLYTYFPVPGVPTIVGIHDTIAEDFPDMAMPGFRARLFWGMKQRAALRSARRVFTVSEHSRASVARRFGIAPDELTVVPEAPDPVFRPPTPTEEERSRTDCGLDATEPFLLYAGGISPHKNIPTLVRAYAELARTRDRVPRLVLVGDLQREAYASAAAEVMTLVDELGLNGNVVLPGFVRDETLAGLYGSATAVVLPSLAEGFGLPAVEAAACGAPLVVSDLPPHRASLGEAASYFPPTDAAALRRELERVLGSEDLRRDLGARARAQVADLTWDAAAERLQALIREVARGTGG